MRPDRIRERTRALACSLKNEGVGGLHTADSKHSRYVKPVQRVCLDSRYT